MDIVAMSAWASLLQSIAVIGILVVALGFMIGAVNPFDAGKSIGLLLGIAVALILLPRLIINSWDGLPVWKRFGSLTVVFIVLILQRGARQPRKHDRE